MSKQSNIDKGFIEIAKKVSEAVRTAEAAKNVTFSVDDAGAVSLNGKETGATVSTPSTISKAVGAALGSPDTASRIHDEQAAFRQQQNLSNIQIALEKGVYYIEDGLTSDLRGKALSGYWKTNKQTPQEAAKVSAQIQNYINSLPSGVMVKARYGSVFSVDKNVGAMPEKFGADGRRLTVGGMTLTIDGAQPCIYIDKDSGEGRVYDFRGAMFIVESAGLGLFEFTGDNNVILHGGILRTRALLEFGYVRGADRDKMLFAPIDGWTKERPDIGFGYADKGLWELGFNTTTLRHDLARYRNNAAQVHEVRQPEGMNKARCAELTRQQSSRKYESVGGYWDENGESAFPQDDGTTSPMWGKWRGGQRGSRGNGITLYNCRNTTIYDFDIEGFDGSAIQAGLYGTQDCQDVQGGDVRTAEAKGMIAYDTLICGGWFDKMYTGGIGAVRVVGFTVTGLQCQGNKVGHPDWSVEHSRDGNMVTVDPGYMLWTSRYMPLLGVVYSRNNFGVAARKVIDAHAGNDIVIEHNTGSAGYYGISVVVEEVFAAAGGRTAPAESSTYYYQESNMLINNNNVISGVYGIHLNNGATGIKARKDQNLWWLRANIKVRDNIVKAPFVGLIYNYGHYGFDITGNSVTFANRLGEPYGQRRLNTIAVTSGGTGYSTQTYLTITGGGEMARDGHAEPVIKDGVITSVIVRQTGTRYENADSVVVTAVDPAGTGSGAAFKATVSETSYAYMIGAEARYGAMQVNFSGNRSSNSPDGNFGRLLVSGACIGSTFRDNFFNETPYVKGEDAAKPYVSTREYVHRSGIASQLLAQTQDHVDSFHENNKAINELTGKVTELSFKNKYVTTKAPEKALSEAEIDKLVSAKVAAAVAAMPAAPASATATAAPAPAAPTTSQGDSGSAAATQAGDGAAQNQAGGAAQTIPAPESSQPVSASEEESAKQVKVSTFSFDDATDEGASTTDGTVRMTVAGTARMTNTASLVHKDDPHKSVETRLAAASATSGRWWAIDGLNTGENENVTLILPIRVDAFPSNRSVMFLASGKLADGSQATGNNASVLITKSTTEEGRFTFNTNARVHVNGAAVKPAQTYATGEWLILALTWQAEIAGVALLGRHDGNPVVPGRIGAGATVLRGADLSAAETVAKINELKQIYSIV